MIAVAEDFGWSVPLTRCKTLSGMVLPPHQPLPFLDSRDDTHHVHARRLHDAAQHAQRHARRRLAPRIHKTGQHSPLPSFFPTRARASTREFAIHPLHTAGRQTHFGRRGALVARRHTPSSKIPFVLPRLLTPTHHEWARSERATRRRTPAVTRKIRQQGSKSSG